MRIRIDPEFRRLIMPLGEDERAQLERNLVADGCRDPLVAWKGVLLDGHNRYEICRRRRIPFRVRAVKLPDRLAARIWIRWNQLGRRNLTDDQRALQVAGLVEDVAAQSRRARASTAVNAREVRAGRRPAISREASSRKIDKTSARTKTARRARVSEWKVRQAQAVKAHAPELLDAVAAGEMSLAEAVRSMKPAARAEKLAAAIWPEGKFGVILADPPWKPDAGVLDPSRQIENQYPTLSLDDLLALGPKVDALAADDCILLLWTTAQKIGEAVALIEGWRFVIKSGAVWVKDSIGMGYWFRLRHELLILATRGAPMTPLEADRPDSVLTTPRRGHSMKPDEIYSMVERMFPTIPKVEIFARATRDGWGIGTNEVALREVGA